MASKPTLLGHIFNALLIGLYSAIMALPAGVSVEQSAYIGLLVGGPKALYHLLRVRGLTGGDADQ